MNNIVQGTNDIYTYPLITIGIFMLSQQLAIDMKGCLRWVSVAFHA